MVLLVVDTQKALMNSELFEFELFKSNVTKLINTARDNGIEVIFVRHDDGVGNELSKGEDGFEIYDEFAPKENEAVFDKSFNSSFKDTGLNEYLNGKGVKNVIVVGLQTDFCIDATIKAGFESGYNMIVPSYANSTFDNQYLSSAQAYSYYNEYIWKNRYAECISIEDTVKLMIG